MRDSIFKPRFQVGMYHTRWKRPYIFGRIPHFDSTNYLTLISRSFSTIFKYQTFSVVWVERNLYFGRPAPWLIVENSESRWNRVYGPWWNNNDLQSMGQTLDCFCKDIEFMAQSHRPEEAISDSYDKCTRLNQCIPYNQSPHHIFLYSSREELYHSWHSSHPNNCPIQYIFNKTPAEAFTPPADEK